MQTLGMFTKFWEPGCVKTRLAKDVGATRAAEIYRVFVEHLAHQLAATGESRYFVVSPDRQQGDKFFRSMSAWKTIGQGEGDLGHRMVRFFERAKSVEDRIVVIGGDCPTLMAKTVERAFTALQTSRVVIGPSADGGYYLLGLRGPLDDGLRCLFDSMPWGTDQVLSQSIERLGTCRIEPFLLSADCDIDTVSDLNALLPRLPIEESGGLHQRLLLAMND